MGRQLARVALEGGGSILFEASDEAAGPVKAGRIGDAVRDLPVALSAALAPVTSMARTVLSHLREAGPAEVEVEFGVDLAAEAGVVVSRTETACHLTVRLVWRKGDHDPAAAGAPEE
ncbi:CU044_2847 family protein [Kitasatospora sp. NPDC002551]|uniref:CU044_2847 family protein n=1 Tax=unclassified Kitasatospora TaxID=2633591 RepID=UPI0033328C8E